MSLLPFEPIIPSQEGLFTLKQNPFLYHYELKLDGFRCLSVVDFAKTTLYTKRHKEHKGFHGLRRELARLPLENTILDGEIVCINDRGHPDFDLLMHRGEPMYYYVFDLLYLQGQDLRGLPFTVRKRKLKEVLPSSSTSCIRLVDSVPSSKAAKLIRFVEDNDIEGIIAKRSDAPYDPGQPNNWVKVINPNYTKNTGRWKWFKERK